MLSKQMRDPYNMHAGVLPGRPCAAEPRVLGCKSTSVPQSDVATLENISSEKGWRIVRFSSLGAVVSGSVGFDRQVLGRGMGHIRATHLRSVDGF